jgi:excisionase family DNA binding protein
MAKKSTSNDPQAAANAKDTREATAELLTTRQLMEFLQLSRTKIWELVQQEGLPAFKIGGDYRYIRAEVLAWMEKYRVRKG